MNDDESLADLKGAFCSVNDFHLYGFEASGQFARGTGGFVAATDTSYYLYPKVSFHFKGFAKAFIHQRDDAKPPDHDVIESTDQGFVHFGHALQDPLQLSVGRLPLPFGLHHDHLRYELPQQNEIFWDRTVNGAVLNWRLRNDFTLDLGGTNKNQDKLADKELEAVTIRATKQLDLLSGTKLMGSYQNHGGGSLGKMGLATIVFHNDAVSSLEWVRIAENWRTQNYQQLFRFVYQIQKEEKLWTFEYDDLRRDSYRMVLSVGKTLPSEFVLGGAIQYERQRSGGRESSWLGLINLSYYLTAQTNLLRLL